MEYAFARFKTVDLIVIALLTAVMLIFELSLQVIGATLPMVIAVYLVDPIILIFGVLLVRKFGTIVLAGFLAATLALPTPLFGLPGIGKYTSILPAVLATEIVFLLLQRREMLASVIGGGTVVAVNSLAFYYTALFMGLPSLQADMIVALTIMGFILGSIGGFVGYKLFKKIENKPFVRKILISILNFSSCAFSHVS